MTGIVCPDIVAYHIHMDISPNHRTPKDGRPGFAGTSYANLHPHFPTAEANGLFGEVRKAQHGL